MLATTSLQHDKKQEKRCILEKNKLSSTPQKPTILHDLISSMAAY
jgi:hypothetical protein